MLPNAAQLDASRTRRGEGKIVQSTGDAPLLDAVQLQDKHVVRIDVREEPLPVTRRQVEVGADPMVERALESAAEMRDRGGSAMHLVQNDREAVVVRTVDGLDVGDAVAAHPDAALEQGAARSRLDEPAIVV